MNGETGLERFEAAQERDYKKALAEIMNGRKRSHWMWYIFPQVKGLGFSETSGYYGIAGITEAEAYLDHPILRGRLIEICTALLHLQGSDAHAIFGDPDHLKLRSSMTLFSSVPGANPVFDNVLQKFFEGEKDNKTLQILKLPSDG